MERLSVNTDEAKDVAFTVRQLGVAIKDDYKDVEKKLKALEGAWYGANANEIFEEFHKSVKNRPEIIGKEFVDISDFLRCSVGDGYSVAESRNERLADAFK